MNDPISFETRLHKFLTAWVSPEPAPIPEIRNGNAIIHCPSGKLLATHDPDRLTRLVLLAHRHRLYVQIQLLDGMALKGNEFRLLISPRTYAPGTPDHHPGLSDLIASAYSMAGTKPESIELIEKLLALAESYCSEFDPSMEDINTLASARKFLERNQK